jgi:hypothetical protein
MLSVFYPRNISLRQRFVTLRMPWGFAHGVRKVLLGLCPNYAKGLSPLEPSLDLTFL